MKKELVKINLYGQLGSAVGYKTWNLDVKTVGNALNAIETLSKRKLYKFLKENDEKGIGYIVLINGRECICDKEPTIDDIESIRNSELCAKTYGLKTIDIIPVIRGSDVFPFNQESFQIANAGTLIDNPYFSAREHPLIFAGVVLIVVGVILSIYTFATIGILVILAGIGLIAAGVINLLAKPPKEPEIGARQKQSFLFSGPVNIANEGGPVPVGYGRLIIGSTVITASYEIKEFNADDETRST